MSEGILLGPLVLFATVMSLNVLGDALRERWGVR
jgi:ABC-type dipeptide/oligopeptide/nickel transport system permease subunit